MTTGPEETIFMRNKKSQWMDTGKLRLRYNIIRKLTILLENAEADDREFSDEEEQLWAQHMDELDRLDELEAPSD
jgi:hypothetical protein